MRLADEPKTMIEILQGNIDQLQYDVIVLTNRLTNLECMLIGVSDHVAVVEQEIV